MDSEERKLVYTNINKMKTKIKQIMVLVLEEAVSTMGRCYEGAVSTMGRCDYCIVCKSRYNICMIAKSVRSVQCASIFEL